MGQHRRPRSRVARTEPWHGPQRPWAPGPALTVPGAHTSGTGSPLVPPVVRSERKSRPAAPWAHVTRDGRWGRDASAQLSSSLNARGAPSSLWRTAWEG